MEHKQELSPLFCLCINKQNKFQSSRTRSKYKLNESGRLPGTGRSVDEGNIFKLALSSREAALPSAAKAKLTAEA